MSGGRLGLTVEATILDNEKWHNLFTLDEVQGAARRLQSYGYDHVAIQLILK